ncbi:hypothetical protein AK88_04914 [Plasmodium fragile]|uniref:Uncharacterized protein n=1 Tax=Plasmodium fragile TaxID=5857 RepID=A0A0D9QI94_PLAFR|nr:uncharacterized protein AK88_04914 [Plasmodium fragile]KJP85441.1 hypothetical protein AK88_04914 [Plasmodium fragile]
MKDGVAPAREAAPVYPNEHSAASSPEDAATCPNGQLNRSTGLKSAHKKKSDHVFKNFIYQNIFDRDRFTNIFKKKIAHSTQGKRNDEDDGSGRNEEDASVDHQCPSDEEEYMLFLSYIYNDVTSFIELNKNEHLKNSNYADLEDLIFEICGTVCRDAFRNIKSIFKSPEGEVPRQESVCKHERHEVGEDGGEKGKSHPPSEKDSSFFFIPPMEYLVPRIHKLTSKKDDAKNACHFSSDINEFLRNNDFDKHPIYASLQGGDKPTQDRKDTHKAVLDHTHKHVHSHRSTSISLEAEQSHAHTGGEKQRACDCSGESDRGSDGDSDGRRKNLRSEDDTDPPDVPPTHSQEEGLPLEDATEEITPNEKKNDEEGLQHIHTHAPPVEHAQVGTNVEVRSNNGKHTICMEVQNSNEDEATLAHQQSPDEFTPSPLNGTSRVHLDGAIYSSFSGPSYAKNSHANGRLSSGDAPRNFPHDDSQHNELNNDDGSVQGEMTGDPFWGKEKFTNGSSQGAEQAQQEHRGDIHHYTQSNCSKKESHSKREEEKFEDCLDDYDKPARGANDNQDTDTNGDDSKEDAESEEHDAPDEMEGVASEVGYAEGVNTPSEEHHPNSNTTTHAGEQTGKNVTGEEGMHPCGTNNSDQLEDDKEGITTEGKTINMDRQAEQQAEERSAQQSEKQAEEPPQSIIQVDQKEYREKQQKMVKNKTPAKPEIRREFKKNENPHDDYYHFKYLNNCENFSNPYQYTKVEKKANIQVTPSPFPQFLRDIQIYNISQKKIRLKK